MRTKNSDFKFPGVGIFPTPAQNNLVWQKIVKLAYNLMQNPLLCYIAGYPGMKKHPDIWIPSYYRRLRSDYARRSYVSYLLSLGYTKGHQPGGVVMYPPENWYGDLLAAAARIRREKIENARLPYKDD